MLCAVQGWTAAEARRHWECACSITALAQFMLLLLLLLLLLLCCAMLCPSGLDCC
jgi:hypothetical protein